ncbi:MAG: hypothetical protein RLZZ584_416 [Pseudomonadota bacterium]|jgi:hypothetical protein
MDLSQIVVFTAATFGLAGVVAWGATRHYRNQITNLVRELEEARAAAAHHALWSEEQRIELGRQVRALQTQVARLEALMQNEQKRSSRGSWSVPVVTPGTTAAAAGPQLRPLNLASTMPGVTPSRLHADDDARTAPGDLDPMGDEHSLAHEIELEMAHEAAQSGGDARRESELAPVRAVGQGGDANAPAGGGDDRWRDTPVAANTGYYSSRGGRLTIASSGITTTAEFDFAATQPIDVREARGTT